MYKYLEEIKEALQKPDKITSYSFDEDVRYFYKYYKHLEKPNNYLLVVVKYLNGDDYVISSYLENKIKWKSIKRMIYIMMKNPIS